MADLLSAASLLVTTVAVLYALWYSELRQAAATALPRFVEDRRKPHSEICRAFWLKALPLTVLACLLAAALLPPALSVVLRSWHNYQDKGWHALTDYDPVATIFVLIAVAAIVLATATVGLAASVAGTLRKIHPKRGKTPGA